MNGKVGKSDHQVIEIVPIKRNIIDLRIIGETPMFLNTLAQKAQHELLCPAGRKTASDKKLHMKHDPLVEYYDSARHLKEGPTEIGFPIIGIKSAMCTAAIETAGATKTGAQRLIFMPGNYVSVYGIPKLDMRIVRMADISRTPDVRTRAVLDKWCLAVRIHYVIPQLTARSVTNLLCNAGVLIGIGDFRQDKGKGSYGCFRVIGDNDKDKEWDDLVKRGGREAQRKAFDNPQPYNAETEELLEYYFAMKLKREDPEEAAQKKAA